MKKFNNIEFFEGVLLLLVWMVIIVSPILFNHNETFTWGDLIVQSEMLIPLFLIFIINRLFLVPILLKGRQLLYVLSVVSLIAVFTGISFFTDQFGFGFPQQNSSVVMKPRPNQNFQEPPRRLPMGPNQPIRGPIPPFANLLLFSILLVGFDTGLKASFKLIKNEKEQAKLEKESAETQLAFLKTQVSPHFFMNTLNNIHALIDLDSEEAKESIIRLSKLMRHLLYDSDGGEIPIHKEMEFVKNYVDLMKLRYSDRVKIDLLISPDIPECAIPPLLFTSYLENAFKHGISYQAESYIDIRFTSLEDQLVFEIKNRISHQKKSDEASGIGIENSKKRLDLIFGDRYTLSINDSDNEYVVKLILPI